MLFAPEARYMNYGTLYIVATPIGNLEDITLRALRLLKEADLIAAEDTRVTRKLLSHYAIHTDITSYFEGNRLQKNEYLTGLLKNGKNIALTSSAGTPGISDPGYTLIKQCIENKINVVSVPGPSALISALVTSGLPTDGFVFIGFVPRKRGKIARLIENAAALNKTIVLYESPFRIAATLQIIDEVLNNPGVVVAREMTKKFEEVVRGKAAEVKEYFKGKKIIGECVILLDVKNSREADEASAPSQVETNHDKI